MGNVANFGLFLRFCARLSNNPLWWSCQFSLGRWVVGGVTGRLQDIPLCWGDFYVDVGWSPSFTEVQPDPACVNTLPTLLLAGCSQRSVNMAAKPPPCAQPSHGLLFLRQQLRNSVFRPVPWRHWHISGSGSGGTGTWPRGRAETSPAQLWPRQAQASPETGALSSGKGLCHI